MYKNSICCEAASIVTRPKCSIQFSESFSARQQICIKVTKCLNQLNVSTDSQSLRYSVTRTIQTQLQKLPFESKYILPKYYYWNLLLGESTMDA